MSDAPHSQDSADKAKMNQPTSQGRSASRIVLVLIVAITGAALVFAAWKAWDTLANQAEPVPSPSAETFEQMQSRGEGPASQDLRSIAQDPAAPVQINIERPTNAIPAGLVVPGEAQIRQNVIHELADETRHRLMIEAPSSTGTAVIDDVLTQIQAKGFRSMAGPVRGSMTGQWSFVSGQAASSGGMQEKLTVNAIERPGILQVMILHHQPKSKR